MKGRHHTPEQIVRKLREADRMLGEGTAMVEICKHLEVSEQTYYRWRNQYGGMKADDAKRLKELEKENARLKRIVADQALDIDMLKEVNRGTSKPGQAPGSGRSPAGSVCSVPAGGRARWLVNQGQPSDCHHQCRLGLSSIDEPGCGRWPRPIPATGIAGCMRC